jgi:hypothetical protein
VILKRNKGSLGDIKTEQGQFWGYDDGARAVLAIIAAILRRSKGSYGDIKTEQGQLWRY